MRLGDFGKERSGASLVLGVEFVIVGARGVAYVSATDFGGVALDRAPLEGVAVALTESSVSEKQPMLAEMKKINK